MTGFTNLHLHAIFTFHVVGNDDTLPRGSMGSALYKVSVQQAEQVLILYIVASELVKLCEC